MNHDAKKHRYIGVHVWLQIHWCTCVATDTLVYMCGYRYIGVHVWLQIHWCTYVATWTTWCFILLIYPFLHLHIGFRGTPLNLDVCLLAGVRDPSELRRMPSSGCQRDPSELRRMPSSGCQRDPSELRRMPSSGCQRPL